MDGGEIRERAWVLDATLDAPSKAWGISLQPSFMKENIKVHLVKFLSALTSNWMKFTANMPALQITQVTWKLLNIHFILGYRKKALKLTMIVTVIWFANQKLGHTIRTVCIYLWKKQIISSFEIRAVLEHSDHMILLELLSSSTLQ